MYYTRSVNPENTQVTMNRSDSHGIEAYYIQCGKCWKCRVAQSQMWAARITHEASLHKNNSFITLTYSNEYLPENGTLVKKHFQDFMKRLRRYNPKMGTKHIDADGKITYKIRYYQSAEYGSKNDRPHFHAVLFGVKFKDQTYWRRSTHGFSVYRSETLEKSWTKGHSEIGNVNLKTATYVAKYCTKRITGDLAKEHYGDRIPEYSTMSRSPAIGENYYYANSEQIQSEGTIPYMDIRIKIPRFYKKLHIRSKEA